MMRKSILMSLVCGSLTAILAAGSAAEPNHTPPATATPAKSNDGRLSLEALEPMLKDLGYEPIRSKDGVWISFTVQRDSTLYTMHLCLSGNKNLLWFEHNLWQVDPTANLPASAWASLLDVHDRTCFKLDPESKRLSLSTYRENRNLTPENFSKYIDSFAESVVSSRTKATANGFRPAVAKTEASDATKR